MKYTHRITASVPTVYQYGSINRLMAADIKRWPDGSFHAQIDFLDYESAELHLLALAIKLAENDKEQEAMEEEVQRYGKLTYDCCTANLVEIDYPWAVEIRSNAEVLGEFETYDEAVAYLQAQEWNDKDCGQFEEDYYYLRKVGWPA
jgi:hypothetical protein